MQTCSFCFNNKKLSEFSTASSICKECIRSIHLRKTYGISITTYNKMFEKQEGCCAICGKHQNLFTRTLSVDHCHTTGKVRGLLCINCNTAIGKLKEDVEVIQKAIEYLKEHNEG